MYGPFVIAGLWFVLAVILYLKVSRDYFRMVPSPLGIAGSLLAPGLLAAGHGVMPMPAGVALVIGAVTTREALTAYNWLSWGIMSLVLAAGSYVLQRRVPRRETSTNPFERK